ncbi:hypothetical protein GCM10010359_40690 [Streptomyces morookaense]|nr:hypothetical protein GCM10010359_40690 [Streptomyces morookaense]
MSPHTVVDAAQPGLLYGGQPCQRMEEYPHVRLERRQRTQRQWIVAEDAVAVVSTVPQSAHANTLVMYLLPASGRQDYPRPGDRDANGFRSRPRPAPRQGHRPRAGVRGRQYRVVTVTPLNEVLAYRLMNR